MEKENRFSPEGLKEMENKNYELITDMAKKMNILKGYEVGYSNPKKGKMIVEYNNNLYLVDVEPIGCMGKNTLENAMKEYSYIFK